MRIAYICAAEAGATDRVLAEVAGRARQQGLVLAGAVHVPPPDDLAPGQKCRIVLDLLPDGPVRDISLDLGTGASACRLDAGALEEAALLIAERLPQAQGLIVNKFGKQEAVGRGLVTAIGMAVEADLPVLVGANPEWQAAFLAFAGEGVEQLPADADAAFQWLCAALSPNRTEAAE